MAAGGVLALALALFADRPGRRNSAPDRTSQGDTFEEIDAHIERQMERLNIPGAALAVVEDDEIAHLRSFGETRPGGEAPTSHTPFIIGSLTKSFTALAVMQLVEEGKVELDAPVQRYLPWFRVADTQASAQITVRHLLNQTSGLPQLSGLRPLTDFDDRPDASERQARALSTLELARPVGSAWEYCNMNYNLLGLIVEATSGESYEDYVHNHIFAPLEMTHTYTSHAEAKQNGMAVGSRYWFAVPFAAPDMPLPRGSLAGGELISSSEDMARYLIAHLNEGRYGNAQILSAAGIDELHRPAVEANMTGIPFGHYGMGWIIEETDHIKIVWHSGTCPDFFSYMAILPEQKKGVVLLINANHLMMDKTTFTEVGVGVAKLLAGERFVPNRFGAVPWILRSLPLIPALQVVGVAATLRRLARWHQDPNSHPLSGIKWGRYILLPLIPDLLVSLPLLGSLWTGTLDVPLLGMLGRGTLDVMLLFMPDVSWIALVCGSFALAWMVLRTGLVLWTLRKRSVA
ncbi:MAG TPA: serine hydrolase domain-containing protein [Rubrobacter sp.]|nr:serine hydrolase domain-containing protein [Rubrobacter sp.]